MGMFNDIGWWTTQKESKFLQSAVEVANYDRKFAHGRWSFLGARDEDAWYEISNDKPRRKWNDIVLCRGMTNNEGCGK